MYIIIDNIVLLFEKNQILDSKESSLALINIKTWEPLPKDFDNKYGITRGFRKFSRWEGLMVNFVCQGWSEFSVTLIHMYINIWSWKFPEVGGLLDPRMGIIFMNYLRISIKVKWPPCQSTKVDDSERHFHRCQFI